jgi:hypothetical protein
MPLARDQGAPWSSSLRRGSVRTHLMDSSDPVRATKFAWPTQQSRASTFSALEHPGPEASSTIAYTTVYMLCMMSSSHNTPFMQKNWSQSVPARQLLPSNQLEPTVFELFDGREGLCAVVKAPRSNFKVDTERLVGRHGGCQACKETKNCTWQ